jgi:ankyrin repeat protein
MSEIFDAIESHDLGRLRFLLDRGADPNQPSPQAPAWTPLKGAVEELSEGGPIEAVVLLLRAGAEVDGGRVPHDATALIVAAINRQPEAALLLLAAGADPNARSDEGDTPLSAATRNSDTRTAEILRWCGATES